MQIPSSENRELPQMVMCVIGGINLRKEIPLKQALNALRGTYQNPEEALLKSSEDDPLTVKDTIYWI